ncbi:MAG: Gfo/Idh/MocA family oxidoreductase [Clostridia bacterium]|nr:Gfo/Idh/MocA family oxidoreductase [Clostridia bacterium]
MKRIKIGQIGIGHNHGEGKMLAVRKFPELFEVIGYAEEDEEWVKKRGGLSCYRDLPRLGVEEIIERSDAVLVECDVWNLTKVAKMCVDAGKHVHIDKPASGTLAEFEALLDTAAQKELTVQLGYMYRYNFAIQKLMEMIRSGKLGEIYQIDAEMSTYHSKEYRQWLKHFKGGSMYIFGSHLIDLVVSILGEPCKVHSFIKQTGYEGVCSDDNGFAVLEYEKAIARITTLSVEVNGWGMRRFAVMGSKGTVEIKPIELAVQMYVSTTDIAENAYSDMREKVDVNDVPTLSRYDQMMKDFYSSVIGEKADLYPYSHELAVQRTLCRVVGEN